MLNSMFEDPNEKVNDDDKFMTQESINAERQYKFHNVLMKLSLIGPISNPLTQLTQNRNSVSKIQKLSPSYSRQQS